MIGIYKIENVVNGKVYVGSSIRIDIRYIHHKSELKNETHSNNYLQNSWKKHGEKNFLFGVLEECSKKDLIEREQFWMDKLKSLNNKFGYNLVEAARTGPKKNVKLSWGAAEEIRDLFFVKNLSVQELTNKFGVVDATIKRVLLNERWVVENPVGVYIRKQNNRGKITQEKADEIRKKYIPYEYTINILAAEYGVKNGTIRGIVRGAAWKKNFKKSSYPKSANYKKANAKLSWEIVGKIRGKYRFHKYTAKMLAEDYGVTTVSIYNVIRNKTWKLEDDPENAT